MTWNEFKRLVDEVLAEKGNDGDVEIWYIDTSFPSKDGVCVCVEGNLGLSIGWGAKRP